MSRYDVAAYLWPSFHHEPRMAHIWTEGDGEWQTVRNARPKFDGHRQPRRPLWGYLDEADPQVMAREIELALQYGVNVFIMDWYWYDDQPFLERCLNDGLLPALPGTGMKFYIMWANHDATAAWDPRTDDRTLYWPGAVDRAVFERVADRLIDRYFGHDAYYRIDDKPVFCLYHLPTFIDGLGGVDAARDALDWMRDRARQAGLPGLHLQNTLIEGVPKEILDRCPELSVGPREAVKRLGFDSVTRYQWCHCARAVGDYLPWAEQATADWEDLAREFPMFFPHVSIGWDNNPRFVQQHGLITGETPERFSDYLRKAKAFLDARPDLPPLVTVNSWNEWTESSYLLPDEEHGLAYLEAVKSVFGNA
jgi:hypothetical protein